MSRGAAGLRWSGEMMARQGLKLLLALCCCSGAAGAWGDTGARLLDGFEDLGKWRVSASDGVRASLSAGAGVDGGAMCLNFDFGNVSGYATASRELPLEYPENYEFSFDVRGEAPANDLQMKILDASAKNVWWVNRPDFEFPREWQRLRWKKRHIQFAWGPTADRALGRSAALEFVVASGSGGGKGSVCFARLSLRELPAANGAPQPPEVRASGTLAPAEARFAADGRPDTEWRSDPAAGPEQTVTLDFGRLREFGGLVLRWLPGLHASRYSIDLSDDGEHWRTVRRVSSAKGGSHFHRLPDAEARYVRLHLRDGPARAYGLAEAEVREPDFGASGNAFFMEVAREAPRGHYPRGFSGEQSYWTLVGTEGGPVKGLVSEDGAIESGPGLAAVEPFLVTARELITWADVGIEQGLLDDYLPVPGVTWRHRDFLLQVTVFGSGEPSRSQLNSRYTVQNLSPHARSVTLALAVRPFQVNPPPQFLTTPGGTANVHKLAWDGRGVVINGEPRIYPAQAPDRVRVLSFDEGGLAELLAPNAEAAAPAVEDETGFASGVLLYRLELPPGGKHSVVVVSPLSGPPVMPEQDADTWFDRELAQVADGWREKLNRVTLRLPAAGKPIADTLRTALGHILSNRVGPAIQPGNRAYARSWIRDGTMTAEALLRLGHDQVAREYADWYALRQFANGKVPCCVDRRGADPVAEHDSHGELIHLIGEVYRYGGDRAWLEAKWPRVEAAIGYMEFLRASERGPANREGRRHAYFGLMPVSISHEGYSDNPAYSYWDDAWALTGYNDAVDIASALGRGGDAKRIAPQRDQFRGDFLASIRKSMVNHGIDYIPGAADRGDFDATSITVLLAPAGLQSYLPGSALQRTFERYWADVVARRDGRKKWDEYTPYELRAVGTFVRLGWRERAEELLDFLMADRRPQAWNQWSEIVFREMRKPKWIGEMPHGWIGSDFMRAVLDVFAYERQSDKALVLAAGIPTAWLAGEGIGIHGLRTPGGKLGYTLRRDGSRLILRIAGGLTPPAGGLVLPWPYAGAPSRATVNGRSVRWERGKELRIRALPAEVVVEEGANAGRRTAPDAAFHSKMKG